ncbi:mitogen-activated protein kinase kinase kinase 18-like [Curcuma longa]|uniref:mitogen-activated protein kinase kinase kinase 18-like n=1 Tax=Curcuma longa TaxID=136217 RepID=UPI003D9F141B
MAVGEWRRGPTIGRGSTATVSAAVASPSGVVFAVKHADVSLSAPLQREQGILSSLPRHPNVVSYLGFEVADGVYNLFLEYAPLGSLSDRIEARGGGLEEPDIRSYAGDLLRGLAHLHAAGVAHRDVKCRNVLVFAGGCAKLADFGCARLTAVPPVAGTPMYMAPEAARGEAQGLPADVWALGCAVIEMATGRPPWPDVADPVAALHRAGFTGDVPECPGWLSPEARDFVGKCLKRDASERWTAEQLLRHPFVEKASCSPENASAPTDQIWVSPKSTLEQSMWDSEEEEYHLDSPEERLRRLAGSASPAIDWGSDDDNWITVRSDEMQSPTPTAEDNDELAIAANSNLDLSASDYRNDPFPVESMNQIVERSQSPVFVLNINSKNSIFSSNSPHFNIFFCLSSE